MIVITGVRPDLTGGKMSLLYSRCHPHLEPCRGVQIEHTNRCPTDGGQSDDPHTCPRKMLMPKISPRMIEGRKLIGFRIDAGEVASFMQIALGTGQGQVF